MNTRRKYDKRFKIDAVNMLKCSDKNASEIVRDLGIRPDLISRWRREFEQEDLKAFTGQGTPRNEELAKLRKEVLILRWSEIY